MLNYFKKAFPCLLTEKQNFTSLKALSGDVVCFSYFLEHKDLKNVVRADMM